MLPTETKYLEFLVFNFLSFPPKDTNLRRHVFDVTAYSCILHTAIPEGIGLQPFNLYLLSFWDFWIVLLRAISRRKIKSFHNAFQTMPLRKLLTVSYNEIAVHLFVKTKDLLTIKKEGRKGKKTHGGNLASQQIYRLRCLQGKICCNFNLTP